MKNRILLVLFSFAIIVACNNPGNQSQDNLRNEYEIAIDGLIAQCENFTADCLIQGLPGKWELDSFLVYDKVWDRILEPYLVMGKWCYGAGGSEESVYTFSADGKGVHYVKSIGDEEPKTYVFVWEYDTERLELVLNGIAYKVSGFNDKYIVLDNINPSSEKNIRQILRKVE